MAVIAVVLRITLLDLTVGRTACTVVVAITTARGVVARRVAATARRAIASTSSAFASPSLSNNLFFQSSKLGNEILDDNSKEGLSGAAPRRIIGKNRK